PPPPRAWCGRLGRVVGGGGQRHRARRAQRADPQGRRGAGWVDAASASGAGSAPGAQGEPRSEAAVKQIAGIALRADGATFELLDQTRLPHAEAWLDATETRPMLR